MLSNASHVLEALWSLAPLGVWCGHRSIIMARTGLSKTTLEDAMKQLRGQRALVVIHHGNQPAHYKLLLRPEHLAGKRRQPEGAKMEWTDTEVMQLRILWDEGHSTAEIGRRLGCSKNSVVGKVTRLDLPRRPSPIKRDPSAPPRVTIPRVTGPTLPPLPSGQEPVFRTPSVTLHRPQTDFRSSGAPRVVPVPAAPKYGRVVTCCWPIGEPRTKEFRFCDVPSEPGHPYCKMHMKISFVRVRREEAAA